MIYTFITDLHLGSPMAINTVLLNKLNPREVLLGDIVDLANCAKKEIPKHQVIYNELKKSYGHRYVSGNHERMLPIGEFFIAVGDKISAFCTHGDKEANEQKWTDYRKKPPGAGWLKRSLWVPALMEFEKAFDRKTNMDVADRMALIAKNHGCTAYICGHFHNKEMVRFYHDGVLIMILPRGRTEVEL